MGLFDWCLVGPAFPRRVCLLSDKTNCLHSAQPHHMSLTHRTRRNTSSLPCLLSWPGDSLAGLVLARWQPRGLACVWGTHCGEQVLRKGCHTGPKGWWIWPGWGGEGTTVPGLGGLQRLQPSLCSARTGGAVPLTGRQDLVVSLLRVLTALRLKSTCQAVRLLSVSYIPALELSPCCPLCSPPAPWFTHAGIYCPLTWMSFYLCSECCLAEYCSPALFSTSEASRLTDKFMSLCCWRLPDAWSRSKWLLPLWLDRYFLFIYLFIWLVVPGLSCSLPAP